MDVSHLERLKVDWQFQLEATEIVDFSSQSSNGPKSNFAFQNLNTGTRTSASNEFIHYIALSERPNTVDFQ